RGMRRRAKAPLTKIAAANERERLSPLHLEAIRLRASLARRRLARRRRRDRGGRDAAASLENRAVAAPRRPAPLRLPPARPLAISSAAASPRPAAGPGRDGPAS